MAGCDGGDEQPDPTGTTSTTSTDGTSRPARSSVAVYFLRDGKVSPVRRTIAATPAVARAAVGALLDGPTEGEATDGLASAIPAGTQLRDIAVADGVATVDPSPDGPLDTVAPAAAVATDPSRCPIGDTVLGSR